MKKPANNYDYDLLILGAGSGGLAAAEQAAKLGAKVGIIESRIIGGTCVNAGCIPKKIMWNAASLADFLFYSREYGFELKLKKFSYQTLVKNRNKFIKHLNKIYADRMKKYKIDYIKGHAKFVDAHSVSVNGKHHSAKHIIIAVGCDPNIPDIQGKELGIGSDKFFQLKKQPKSIAIIGNGYISVEMGSLLNKLGSKVKILIRGDCLLDKFDPMVRKRITNYFVTSDIKLITHADSFKITKGKNKLLSISCKNGKHITNVETVLFATGRKPRTHEINLKVTGIKLNNKGYIVTNKFSTTSCKHIYAIGDVTGKKMLTPVAVAEGRLLARRLFGKEKDLFLDFKNIPTVIFSHPPIGSVGMTTQEACEKYGKDNLKIYEVEFNPIFYALSSHKVPTFIKLITLKANKKIVGLHMIGEGVEEILQGFAVAVKMGATKSDFDKTVAIHPTSAEELVTMK